MKWPILPLLYVLKAGTHALFITQTQMCELPEHKQKQTHTCLSNTTHPLTKGIYRHQHLFSLRMHDISSLPALLVNFKSWVHLSPKTGSIRLLPPLALFPFGLSTSLLSMQQWYQAKNVFSVDSRHVGTRASTSMFEPAESEGVNTAALWNISLPPPVSGRRNRRNTIKPYKNRFSLCCLICFLYSGRVISFELEIIYTLYLIIY